MRNDKAGLACHQLFKRLLDTLLGAQVDAAGCLVQNEERRIGQHDPGDTEQLFLSLGQAATVLGQNRVIALGQTPDKAVRIGCLCCCNDLFPCGIRSAVGDIFRHRSGKQPGLLQNHAVAGTQAVPCHCGNILSGNGNLAAVHIIKPEQQINQRRLAAAGRTDNGDALSAVYIQVEICDKLSVRHIGELHMGQLHGAVAVFQFRQVAVVRLCRFVNDSKHTLC